MVINRILNNINKCAAYDITCGQDASTRVRRGQTQVVVDPLTTTSDVSLYCCQVRGLYFTSVVTGVQIQGEKNIRDKKLSEIGKEQKSKIWQTGIFTWERDVRG